jgi:hypothetical protein
MAIVRVLIVDEGRERASVAVARALVARGWTVDSASMSPNIASQSRAVSGWHQVAHTADGEDVFIESVNRVVERSAVEVIFVTWKAAVAALSANRHRLLFRSRLWAA